MPDTIQYTTCNIMSSIDPRSAALWISSESTSFRPLAYIFFILGARVSRVANRFRKSFISGLFLGACLLFVLCLHSKSPAVFTRLMLSTMYSRYWFPGSINTPSDFSEFARLRRSLPYFSKTCTFFLYVDSFFLMCGSRPYRDQCSFSYSL